jgi:hypothetical protein
MRRQLSALVLLVAVLVGGLVTALGTAQASPSWPINPTAPADAGPGRVIVLRPYRADLVYNRVVERVLPLYDGPQDLDALVLAIGDSRWASISRGVVTLSASLLQRPGSKLRVGGSVRALRLVDSSATPAYLSGTGASVVFTNVTVDAVTSAGSGAGPAAESEHRPYLHYVNGSTVEATRSVFANLGAASAEHGGFTLGVGSTLVATDSTFRDSGNGLDVYRARQVSLTRVSLTHNSQAGIVLKHSTGITLIAVTASGNGGSGAELSGQGNTPIGPLSTDHNGRAGVLLRNCPTCVLTGLASIADAAGVIVEEKSTAAVVRGARIIDAAGNGIRVSASRTTVQDATVTNAPGRTGVHLARTATDAQVTGGTVAGGALGVLTNATGTRIAGVAVNAAGIGVRVAGHADLVVLREVTASDNGTGLVVAGGTGSVSVWRLRVHQRGGEGVHSGGQLLAVNDSSISGARLAFNVRTRAVIATTQVTDADQVVQAAAGSHVELVGDTVQARVLAIRTVRTGKVTMTNTTVRAPLGARGHIQLDDTDDFPALPLSWLGIFALIALAIAVALELLRRLRERGQHARSISAPAHVTNIA